MRKHFLFLLLSFICLPVFADKIPLEPIPPKEGEKRHDRELINVPIASIENGEYSSPEYSYTYPASWSVRVNGTNYNYNQFQYMIYNIQNTN